MPTDAAWGGDLSPSKAGEDRASNASVQPVATIRALIKDAVVRLDALRYGAASWQELKTRARTEGFRACNTGESGEGYADKARRHLAERLRGELVAAVTDAILADPTLPDLPAMSDDPERDIRYALPAWCIGAAKHEAAAARARRSPTAGASDSRGSLDRLRAQFEAAAAQHPSVYHAVIERREGQDDASIRDEVDRWLREGPPSTPTPTQVHKMNLVVHESPRRAVTAPGPGRAGVADGFLFAPADDTQGVLRMLTLAAAAGSLVLAAPELADLDVRADLRREDFMGREADFWLMLVHRLGWFDVQPAIRSRRWMWYYPEHVYPDGRRHPLSLPYLSGADLARVAAEPAYAPLLPHGDRFFAVLDLNIAAASVLACDALIKATAPSTADPPPAGVAKASPPVAVAAPAPEELGACLIAYSAARQVLFSCGWVVSHSHAVANVLALRPEQVRQWKDVRISPGAKPRGRLVTWTPEQRDAYLATAIREVVIQFAKAFADLVGHQRELDRAPHEPRQAADRLYAVRDDPIKVWKVHGSTAIETASRVAEALLTRFLLHGYRYPASDAPGADLTRAIEEDLLRLGRDGLSQAIADIQSLPEELEALRLRLEREQQRLIDPLLSGTRARVADGGSEESASSSRSEAASPEPPARPEPTNPPLVLVRPIRITDVAKQLNERSDKLKEKLERARARIAGRNVELDDLWLVVPEQKAALTKWANEKYPKG